MKQALYPMFLILRYALHTHRTHFEHWFNFLFVSFTILLHSAFSIYHNFELRNSLTFTPSKWFLLFVLFVDLWCFDVRSFSSLLSIHAHCAMHLLSHFWSYFAWYFVWMNKMWFIRILHHIYSCIANAITHSHIKNKY